MFRLLIQKYYVYHGTASSAGAGLVVVSGGFRRGLDARVFFRTYGKEPLHSTFLASRGEERFHRVVEE